jgi:hypothetical protein
MGSGDDSRDREVIAALQRPADVPLGMTARLEASVLRRARAPAGFTAAEKVCLASAATIPFLTAGAGSGLLLLLLGVGGVLGYLQWTVLVEEPSEV